MQKSKISILVFSFFVVCISLAETFAERFASIRVSPEEIFYKPEVSSAEFNYYQAGRMRSWVHYSKEANPQESLFNGYVLFADPYHEGQKKISFLLGADCSSFVHRLFQLMGADYPFAKTRYLLAIANNAPKTQGLSECKWKKLQESFKEVVSEDDLRVGDVFVYSTVVDEFGERGHMGVISSLNPITFLESKYKKGYNQEEQVFEQFLAERKPHFFRYQGQLREIKSRVLKDLMAEDYPFDNSACESVAP